MTEGHKWGLENTQNSIGEPMKYYNDVQITQKDWGVPY